jgi:hypothetical protein
MRTASKELYGKSVFVFVINWRGKLPYRRPCHDLSVYMKHRYRHEDMDRGRQLRGKEWQEGRVGALMSWRHVDKDDIFSCCGHRLYWIERVLITRKAMESTRVVWNIAPLRSLPSSDVSPEFRILPFRRNTSRKRPQVLPPKVPLTFVLL